MTIQEVPLDRNRNRSQPRNSHDLGLGRHHPFNIRYAQDISFDLNAPYLIKGLVNPKEISFWYGPSSSGKTFFLQHVFWRFAQGHSVLGRRVRGGRVVYFSMEPGHLDRRLSAARQVYGENDSFACCEDALNLFATPSAAEDIASLLRSVGAAVVVIDPISAAMSGANENDYVDVSVVVAKLRSIAKSADVHVACVAHTGKDEARGQRGSSHFFASGDLVVSISDGGGDVRVAEIMKARDARKGEQFRFQLCECALGVDSDGDQIETLTVEIDDRPGRREPPAAKLTKGDLQALGWLREAIQEHGEVAPSDIPGERVTTRDRWMEVARKRTDEKSDDALRKAITRAITHLTVAHAIGIRAPFFWLTK